MEVFTCKNRLDKLGIMIVFIQFFHIEKKVLKNVCSLRISFYPIKKNNLQITQTETTTAFPTLLFLADRVILNCLFLAIGNNYCAFN